MVLHAAKFITYKPVVKERYQGANGRNWTSSKKIDRMNFLRLLGI